MTAGSACTCSGVPRAMTRPKSRTTTAWQTAMTRSIRCSTSSTAVSADRLVISSRRSSISASDSPPAGSSSSSSRGWATRARASATRFLIPNASCCGMASASPGAPTRSSASSAWPRSARSSRSLRGSPPSADQNPARAWRCAPIITFSSTDSRRNRPTPCSVRAMPSAASWCGCSRRSSAPSNRSRPGSGRTKPQSTFSSVVLPAPFGPMMPVTWRGAAASDTSSSAVSPPNRTVTPCTSSRPVPVPAGGGPADESSFTEKALLR